MNLLPAVLPKVRVFDVPLVGDIEPAYTYEPRLGVRMRELIPIECGRAVLIVNGNALLQAEWNRRVGFGDVVDWHIIPRSGNASRTILTIIAVIAIAYFTAGIASAYGPGWAAAFSITANLAAQILINALIPIKAADSGATGGISPGSVYNTSLSGNQARLNQPIPVGYGRMKTFPDFACQPYPEYLANDQYYNVIICVGQGYYAIEAILIDDTPISNFKSVFYKVLPPGTAPTRVKGNIVAAIEVAGNTLEATRPVGGFVVNKSLTQINRIEWDIVAEQGLGVADASTGAYSNFTVAFDVDIQYVDDFGVPTGAWANLSHSSVTAASRTPQRFTFSKDLPTPGRVSVRFTRTTALNTSNLVANAISLTGLRGELTAPATLCATATYIEIVMRANEQLNGLTQKKVGVIWRRKLLMWSPLGGWTVTPAETRNLCWAVVDKLKNTVYGDSLTDEGIDLQGFYNLSLIYDQRQDHLDVLFDSRVTSMDANRTMGQVGRAVVFQRMGVFTITRDQYQALPAAAYTTRDIIPGTTSIGYALPTPETADAISYEYFDQRSWQWTPIVCKLPGVVTPVRPVTLRVLGIGGSFQALREGTYLAAVNLYRRKFPKWQTEMKGLLSAYGSAVIFSPALPGWGHPGDMVAWDGPSRRAQLSEPPVWTPGANHFITLERPNGQLTIAIPVTPGPVPNEVVLGLDPPFTPITLDSDSERTKYVFGPEGQHQVIVRLTNIAGKGKAPSGNPIIEMSGVAENNLVHTADNPYLPAGGVIQDPVPTTIIDDTSSTDPAPDATSDERIVFIGENLATGDTVNPDMSYWGGAFGLKLNTNGSAFIQVFDDYHKYLADTPSSTDTLVNQWFAGTPEPGVTSQYEVNVRRYGFDATGGILAGSAEDVFLPLSADRRWVWAVGNDDRTDNRTDSGASLQRVNGILQVQIRRVGSTVNLIDTTMTWTYNFF